ncbi:glycosyltransferase [Isoptericola croceus]|uniref:glycosyltransferase n=1 Tax=Isoptericola croceus TaxID=3031406 RepID=UPI0023F818E4|nr:glycosyltransferase [Isoptericola croceus]
MRILRISHSAVVDAWREREVEMRRQGDEVRVVTAAVWDEGGRDVSPRAQRGEDLVTARTVGHHPALFLYDPVVLWRALGEPWDVLDVHEEPVALATAEVLAIRAARRVVDTVRRRRPSAPAPYFLYSAQNLLKRYPWPFRRLERSALRHAAGVVTCNHDAARIMRYKGARGAVERIPLGVDTTLFSPSDADLAGTAGPQVRVGYAGRLTTQKGVSVLIEAVARDARLDLVVAGAGPEQERLRQQAASLGGRVQLLGPLETAELPDFYRSVDVLVVPSVVAPGLAEQFGRVAVEAMACGTPVVATRVGSVPDIVAGAGVLVEPGDPAAILEGIREATRPDVAGTLREAGLARAADCSWPVIAEQYRKLYTTAVRAASRSARDTGTDAATTHPSTSTPRIEVVVVAYGAPELLRAALEPIAGTYPVTVVDNSSSAEHREITDRAGGVYLDPGRNVGFAAAVNVALGHRQDPAADVLLLNPDAIVTPEAVEQLYAALHEDPVLASVGPAQVDGSGTPGQVAWPFPSPARAWWEALGLGRFRIPGERSFVIGSALLLRAAALRSVGPLDERFFLYAEEADWAFRAHRLGWRHAVVDAAEVVHEGAGTGGDRRRRELHFHASQERYLRKHYGTAGWAAARAALVTGAALRSAVLRGARRDAARHRLHTYLAGPAAVELREVAVT